MDAENTRIITEVFVAWKFEHSLLAMCYFVLQICCCPYIAGVEGSWPFLFIDTLGI